MEYISLDEAEIMWSIPRDVLENICINGFINGAKKINDEWCIPENSEKPRTSQIDEIKNIGNKKTNPLKLAISDFFKKLEIYDDIKYGHNHKSFIHGAIDYFLERETKESAFEVYRAFVDSYHYFIGNEKTPILELLDKLRSFEENASVLTAKQRDHYIHSVNVFILGIAIYSRNNYYMNVFDDYIQSRGIKPIHNTKYEEFFIRWGFASLFHDIGYPAEITANQTNQFFNYITSIDGDDNLHVQISISDFDELNSIYEVIPKDKYTKSYVMHHNVDDSVNLLCSTELMAHYLHTIFGIDLSIIKNTLNSYVKETAEKGFVDHGFYSALILLKWYGYLIQLSKFNPDLFFNTLLDSATAILLHNYYRNYMCEGKKFDIGPLNPTKHPIAWLLMLCDEMQEWNREAYGILDKKRTHASEASISISNSRLSITYITKMGTLNDNFSENKENDFHKLLMLDTIFPDGFAIGCETMDNLYALIDRAKKNTLVNSNIIFENLEKLAIAIHDLYNQNQLLQNPNQILEYPSFSDLTDNLKFSNMRQARDIAIKLEMIGCEMKKIDENTNKLPHKLTDEEIEFLAEYEHYSWKCERVESGWIYGQKKDVHNKISPYILPYSKLDESIKELDRDTIKNIPFLLSSIGMAIYNKNQD